MKKYKVTLKAAPFSPNCIELVDQFETTYEYIEASNQTEAEQLAQDMFMKEYLHHNGEMGRCVYKVEEII